MKYFIVDVESTNGATNNITEIIEIGYTIVDTDKVISQNGVYVKPHYSSLDPFIINLTGITNSCLQDAEKFNVVVEKLTSEYSLENYIFVAWGDYDSKMLDKMCDLWEIPRLNFARRINLKKEHKKFYGFKDERGLQRALRHAMIEFDGSPHSGADDAFNTAKLLLDMKKKGWQHSDENKKTN